MTVRPSRIWKDLPINKRVVAADAFWRDEDAEDIHVQHIEAIVAIAKRMNFRPKSVQALPIDRRAKQLAQLSDVSDALATRALISYHFAAQRPLMSAFLDALGIAHENGLITAEGVEPPGREALAQAADKVREGFPADDVTLYLRTLAVLDAETWVNLESLLQPGA